MSTHNAISTIIKGLFGACLIFAGGSFCGTGWAQIDVPIARPPVSVPPVVPTSVPQDVLGRTTPRGTVIGFLSAARKGEDETAAQYLDTRLRGKSAAILAHKLFVVLDRRLPARLNQLSDQPEGSMGNLLKANVDLVGMINSARGDVEITVVRVDRGKAPSVWLFSSKALDAVPDLYEEVNAVTAENVIPQFLVETRIAGIPLYEWIALFGGMPLLYLFTILSNRLVSSLIGYLRRRLRRNPDLPNPDFLPAPVRLLLVAAIIKWILSIVSLPLLARQFWSSTASVITITACVWLIILLNSWGADHIHRRLRHQGSTGAAVVLLARRTIDVLVIFVGILVGLHYFGVNPAAALAGLGVGGIAVALAAQKTLENVIGGVSVIFDHAVHVGETLKVGDTLGTVQDIGLRSTRIRTLDRTVVSVPNGQIANASLENLSLRDKFWFNHVLRLNYATTVSQMRSVLEGVSNLLEQHSRVERDSVRVRFLRLGACSLDVEIFAYSIARDWSHFLGIQGELLLEIMEIVQAAGTRMALPSQTLYLGTSSLGGGENSAQDLFQAPTPDKTAMKQKEVQHDSRTEALTGSPR